MRRLIGMIAAFFGLLALLGLYAWVSYEAIDALGVLTVGLGLGQWLGQGVAAIVFVQLLFVMIVATLLTLAERKWSAAMQDRIGPNRARIAGLGRFSLGGLPHVAADALKMIFKEDVLPEAARSSRLLYQLAPVLNFAPIFCLFAIVPMGPPVTFIHLVGSRAVSITSALQISNPDVGLLFVFGVASLAVYGVSLAGWASGNKLALLGGVRASSQMIAYEVALGLGLVGMMMAAGTLRLDQMTQYQSQGLFGTSWLPAWGLFLQPAGFLLFFTAAFAETKRTPFDLPEGESEIIGYFLEYSGMKFGMFMIAEFIEIVTLSGIVVAVFLGGWHLSPLADAWLRDSVVAPLVRARFSEPQLIGPSIELTMAVVFTVIFIVKLIVLCWLQLLIRWTFPRFRYDQVQTLGWRILLPLGLGNVFLTGLLLLLDGSTTLLGVVGLTELAFMGLLVLWTDDPVKVRPEKLTTAPAGGHP
ncbi:MAG: complex I subunit 1/NuoH family protein [Deltaproteobacteria bacterium]